MRRPTTLESLSETRSKVVERAQGLGLPISEKKIVEVEIAVGEAVTNCARHSEDKRIDIDVRANGGDLVVEIKARSHALYRRILEDKLRQPIPQVAELKEGGMGINIMRQLTKEISIREDGTLCLVFGLYPEHETRAIMSSSTRALVGL